MIHRNSETSSLTGESISSPETDAKNSEDGLVPGTKIAVVGDVNEDVPVTEPERLHTSSFTANLTEYGAVHNIRQQKEGKEANEEENDDTSNRRQEYCTCE